MVSYTILTKTLESKIQRDRQTFVQLIAHLVGDDLTRSGAIAGFYQTYPPVAKIFSARYPDLRAKAWLQETYFTHPRIDGMFITTADGRLLIFSLLCNNWTTSSREVDQVADAIAVRPSLSFRFSFAKVDIDASKRRCPSA